MDMDKITPEDLPEWTDDPIDRLRHTLTACAGRADDEWAVLATSGFVPGHRYTGLTYGDLRLILAEFDETD